MSNLDYLNYTLGGELYHHGVKGMKWGVRKQKRAARRASKLRSNTSRKELRNRIKNGNVFAALAEAFGGNSINPINALVDYTIDTSSARNDDNYFRRASPEEESEFWKSLAAYYEKQGKKGK